MSIEALSPYRKWNLKGILICHLLILFLVGSYLWPATRPIWDIIDKAFFQLTNASLNGPKWWQTFWAMANHRYADWLEDICIIAVFATYIQSAHKHFKLRKIAEFVFCIFFAALIIYFVNELFFRSYLRIPRPSPTLVFEGSVKLSDHINWLKIKDTASRTFPGDHATTALLFGSCALFFIKGRMAKIAAVYAAFLCLPRLFTGAHWLSDIIMGSISIVLFFFSWVFFTAIHAKCILSIEKFFNLFRLKKQSKLFQK